MSFLDFFEALIGCAQCYVTDEVIHGPLMVCVEVMQVVDQSQLTSDTALDVRVTA